jgi:hypothetical protein
MMSTCFICGNQAVARCQAVEILLYDSLHIALVFVLMADGLICRPCACPVLRTPLVLRTLSGSPSCWQEMWCQLVVSKPLVDNIMFVSLGTCTIPVSPGQIRILCCTLASLMFLAHVAPWTFNYVLYSCKIHDVCAPAMWVCPWSSATRFSHDVNA